MIIDGHAHLWELRHGFDIKPAVVEPSLARDILPDELGHWCERTGIDKVVVTQSAPQQAETEFLLDLCRDVPLIVGVTGWVDLAAQDVGENLDRLARHAKFVGVRAQLPRMADDSYIVRPEVQRGLRALVARDLVLVLLAGARHHDSCLSALRRSRDLRVVLNHCGMPGFTGADLAAWSEVVVAYASQTNVVAQLSGLTSLAGAGWTLEKLRPVVFRLFGAFGPNRIMFASDWPMTDLHADYGRWWDTVQTLLEELCLTACECHQVFCSVATRAYRLDIA